ncbi:ribosomal protein S18 acetylase RimI-like enzyme [Pedobacter cryoconitis]|uniref:Ribosomal protein S18 acetylase RimI-like enzyme n=1 Tax=Pedobacter cryoconitis TaxID=188932 RepID=A0A7W8ZNG8_9SPHI|nr:GNAT family N-acetyltransferase [Pedobacter cryoconitis]MBB5637241.1 ribosomal protein S18 acetylase RimI-like enzyme [Pedobacter cryoconitis]MBB6274001.1 ribosomal protein S18 acetylase RimI-like enzyme [Pedobacter cryoconitis]
MIEATLKDKSLVIDILSNSFDSNKSVNYIIKQDSQRVNRIKALMSYSFDSCFMFGKVYLSDNRKACALILFPDQKKFSLRAIWLDLSLVFKAIGINRAGKAMSRESQIKSNYPKQSFYYLWFLGVLDSEQHKGTGTSLLEELILDSQKQNREIYLETSTTKNIPWYSKFNFKIYKEIDFGYKLYMLKRDITHLPYESLPYRYGTNHTDLPD